MRPFADAAVAEVFAGYPSHVKDRLLALRELIFETAASTAGVGELEETLKWGEPAYVTSASKSGSTIRIDWKESAPDRYCMYFHCRTTLVERFRILFSNVLEFEGNRAIVLPVGDGVPEQALKQCIAAALTYHLRERSAHHGRRA